MVTTRGKNVYTTSEVDTKVLAIEAELAKARKFNNDLRNEINSIKLLLNAKPKTDDVPVKRRGILRFLRNPKLLLRGKA